MIIEQRGLPRYVNDTGIFTMPYLIIMPIAFLGDIIIFFSVDVWITVSVSFMVIFSAWFFYNLFAARKAIVRYIDTQNVMGQQFALFFLFPMSSASTSLATAHIQYLSVILGIILVVKGAWLYAIWCIVRFFAVGRIGALLNPTFQAKNSEQASGLFAVLKDVQNQLHGY